MHTPDAIPFKWKLNYLLLLTVIVYQKLGATPVKNTVYVFFFFFFLQVIETLLLTNDKDRGVHKAINSGSASPS